MSGCTPAVLRRRYEFTGAVQGVGFRPFIYRLASGLKLGGFVLNSLSGVTLEVEGHLAALTAFEAGLKDLPPQAVISGRSVQNLAPSGETSFAIVASAPGGERRINLPPDTATCPNCLREIFDPQNRRYRYAFTNCTDCGPRLTIVSDLPYDRSRTSMAGFELCEACAAEYADPHDRRFHAEPNACPVCGPRLELRDANGQPVASADPLRAACENLKAGQIVAIKSLGGFHLAVMAADELAVTRLRERKQREAKPLAVMVRDIDAARHLAEVSEAEAELLLSPARPIVLCRRLPAAALAPSVAPGLSDVGLMLPYNPLQHLLMAECGPLVMTSANLSDEPLCIDNAEALKRLAGIADSFLLHDRAIVVRNDDSLARVIAGAPRLIRRSRGYTPATLSLNASYPAVIALGGQMKNTACLITQDCAVLSPHVGELDTPKARDFHTETLELLYRLTDCRPQIAAVDLHPDYYPTRAAQNLGFDEVIAVQHHHAHIVSCMAEHGLTGPVIGLALDGTGYGSDGRIWGGEVLLTRLESFDRLGHLSYFGLPGGEKAVHEPWRTAASLLRLAYGASWPELAARLELLPAGFKAATLEAMLAQGLNSPLTSSLGRLCDGVAALLGLSRTAAYEGAAPMRLEACAAQTSAFEFSLGVRPEAHIELDPAPLIRDLNTAFLAGAPLAELSLSFHRAVCKGFAQAAAMAAERSGLKQVCLGGGCCQNRLLLTGLIAALESHGLEVFSPSLIPAGDGGLALGQALSAAHQIKLRSLA